MSSTQFTVTIDRKGNVNMGDLTAFIDTLPRVQQAIIASHTVDKMLDHVGNKERVTDQLVKSIDVITANFMFNL
jgi:hypothetical protein